MRENRRSMAKNLILIGGVSFIRLMLQIQEDQAIKYKRFLLLNIVKPVVIKVR
jgi:hypothetical protein